MSWYNRSGYAKDSQSDYVAGRPIISYDVASGTRTYVTRIESRVSSGYKYPASHVSLDKYNYGRPREVEEFLTQVLDEVNGLPALAVSPKGGRPSSPVKVYSTQAYGTDYYSGGIPLKSNEDHGDPYAHGGYDQLPQSKYGVPDKQYWDQSHMKPGSPRDSEASKQSHRPVYDHANRFESPTKSKNWKDYEAPKNQWGNSLKDHEVPKNQWDKSSSPNYDSHSPRNQFSNMANDHGGTNSRWVNSDGKPQSPSSYGMPPSNGPSYNYSAPYTNAGGVPSNYGKDQSPGSYGIPNGSSGPVHDYPPSSGDGAPYSKWVNSRMKPQSPKDHGSSDRPWPRLSSPSRSHSPPTRNTGGIPAGNQWGNSVQPPKDLGAPKNRWERSSSPVRDNPPLNKNNGGFPSSQWGHSSMKPQPPMSQGVPDKQWDRSSSPARVQPPPPTKNLGGAPRNQWGYSQPPKDHGVPNNQWDRSSSPVHVQPPPSTKNLGGAPRNQWGYSQPQPPPQSQPQPPPQSQPQSQPQPQPPPQSQPQSQPQPQPHGVPNNQWDRSSSPARVQPPPPTMNLGGAPRNQWGYSQPQPQPPKDHGIPNNQWDRSSSPVHVQPPSSTNYSMKPQPPKDFGVPFNQWNGSSSPVHADQPPPSKNLAVAPSNRWGNSSMRPHPPKDLGVPNNEGNRQSGHAQDHSPPTRNTGGIPSNGSGNSLMKPQPLKDPRVPSYQGDRPSKPTYEDSPPTRNTSSVPSNPWGYSPMKPQPSKEHVASNNQPDRSSHPIQNYQPPIKNTEGVPNEQFSGKPVNSESPKSYHQWSRTSSPIRDDPPPIRNTIGGSSMQPQAFKVTDNSPDEHTGNKNFLNNKPVQYPYGNPPKVYGSTNGRNLASPERTPTPQGKVPIEQLQTGAGPAGTLPKASTADNLSGIQPRHPYSNGPNRENKAGPGEIDSAEAVRRYSNRSYPAQPSTSDNRKRSISSHEAAEMYNGVLV